MAKVDEYKPYKPKGLKVAKSKAKTGKTYTPLWEAIKVAGSQDPPQFVSIACPPPLRRRIDKAIAKEKSLDVEWPLLRYRKVRSRETADGLDFWLEPYRKAEYTAKILSGKLKVR